MSAEDTTMSADEISSDGSDDEISSDDSSEDEIPVAQLAKHKMEKKGKALANPEKDLRAILMTMILKILMRPSLKILTMVRKRPWHKENI